LFNKNTGVQNLRPIDYEEVFKGMVLNISDTNNKPLNAKVKFSLHKLKNGLKNGETKNLDYPLNPSLVGHYNVTKVAN
jgi:hypothetical protein